MIKIGIIGSGFIAKGFFNFSQQIKEIKVSKILTRSNINERFDLPKNILTNKIDDIILNSDIIVECSGDTIYATDCINEIVNYEIPIITMNSEFHITCGNYFYKKGIIFESQGDQSGCIFNLNNEIKEMGFSPLVYGNYKKYLKYDVSLRQATYWSKKNNISLDKTIAFTDGTKVEIENTFIANSLGAFFHDNNSNKNQLEFLINEAINTKKSYVDFFVDKNYPSGIFIATSHKPEQNKYLKYLGFKKPYQIIQKPYHFCHLEIYKSIKDVMKYNIKNQMRNNIKRYMVASVTKKELKSGDNIGNGLGSFEFRGVHHKYNKNIFPITLLKDVVIKKDLPKGHILKFTDVEYRDNLATRIWKKGYV